MTENNLKQIINKVSEGSNSAEKSPKELIQLVVFELDKEEYAVQITDLEEIIKIPEITPIPNSPEYIRGILNLRGKIIVVIDLEKRFNLVRENKVEPKHIIIAEVGNTSFGVIVDKVTEVLRVPVKSIQSTPSLVSSKIQTDYLKGVVVIDREEPTKELTEEECRILLSKGKEGEAEIERSARLLILLDLPKMLQERELAKVGKEIKSASEKLN